MPSYRDPEYAELKKNMNPKNRGFWDLQLTGEYYRGIKATISISNVLFNQTISNPKITWLHKRIGTSGLGITKEQMEEVQIKNAPKIKAQIEKILNGV